MKKKNIIIAVLVVCSLLIAGSGGYLVFKAINDKQSDDSYRNLASSYVHMTDPSGMSQENAYTADATSGTGVTYAASSAAPSTVPATTVVPYLPAEQNPKRATFSISTTALTSSTALRAPFTPSSAIRRTIPTG